MSKPVLSNPIALRIPADVLSDIEAVAETTDRSRSWVIIRAIRTYMLGEGADILAFRRGKEEIANGDFEDIDDVIADVERIISEKVV